MHCICSKDGMFFWTQPSGVVLAVHIQLSRPLSYTTNLISFLSLRASSLTGSGGNVFFFLSFFDSIKCIVSEILESQSEPDGVGRG